MHFGLVALKVVPWKLQNSNFSTLQRQSKSAYLKIEKCAVLTLIWQNVFPHGLLRTLRDDSVVLLPSVITCLSPSQHWIPCKHFHFHPTTRRCCTPPPLISALRGAPDGSRRLTEVRTVWWFTEWGEYNGPKTSFSSTLLRDESWVASELKTLELINIWSFLPLRSSPLLSSGALRSLFHSLISGAWHAARRSRAAPVWAGGGGLSELVGRRQACEGLWQQTDVGFTS